MGLEELAHLQGGRQRGVEDEAQKYIQRDHEDHAEERRAGKGYQDQTKFLQNIFNFDQDHSPILYDSVKRHHRLAEFLLSTF
jgi:hypothetical protein